MDCLDLTIVWSCCVELVDWQKQHLWLEHMYLVSYQGNIFMYPILSTCVCACMRVYVILLTEQQNCVCKLLLDDGPLLVYVLLRK